MQSITDMLGSSLWCHLSLLLQLSKDLVFTSLVQDLLCGMGKLS